VQITISPAPDGGSVLTKDAAARSYPLVESLDTEPFTVAPGVVGFAFERGDAAGALTDVWFEYKGYLYQFDSFNGGKVELLPIVRPLTLL